MHDHQFDALTRFVSRVGSRRALLRSAGAAGLASIGLGKLAAVSLAQDATPSAPPVASPGADPMAAAQAAFDALDPETRDSIARALWTTDITVDQIPADALAQIIGPKNSNTAFGLRMGARLLELIAQPLSFVQTYSPRYEELATVAQSLDAHQAYLLANLIGPEQTRGFPPIPKQADFDFPQRNAVDLTSQIGWYFFVGSAVAEDGQEYGIEMMFFRSSLVPPDMAQLLELSDVENQVVEMHFAIAKAGDRHYQAKPYAIAGTTGLLTFETDKLGATMGKNSITSTGGQTDADDIYPIRLQAWGQDDGLIEPVQFSMDLTFTTGKSYLLQGAEGCTPCCDGIGTLYYSIPGLTLDPEVSTLTLDGTTAKLKEGTFWFDHQWGMLSSIANTDVVRAANNLTPPTPSGWDWFMAQFNGSREITAYAIHSNDYLDFYRQTGPNPPGTMTRAVHAKYMDPDAVTHAIEGQLQITEWILSVDTPAPDVYPPTYTWYPNRWEFTFGEDVPEDIRVFTMTPIVTTGQSGFFAGGAQYSEGAVYLTGPNGEDLGRGFAESVGYANTLSNVLRLVGLDANEENMELFGGNPPQPALVLASQAYVFLNQTELQSVLGTCSGLELLS
ncbi:MAG TPA: lipocalin-like domain-containing protein [Thermomicrobiales bacterium]|nr:lipocalin-like domain-containing protein [Thermomicrobiales bacterium]